MMRWLRPINPCQARAQQSPEAPSTRLRAAARADANSAMIESAAESLDIALPDLAATERLARRRWPRARRRRYRGALRAASAPARPPSRGPSSMRGPAAPVSPRCRARPSPWCRSTTSPGAPIWHFDLYRLANAEDALGARHRGGLRRGDLADRMAGPARRAAAGAAARPRISAPPPTRTPARRGWSGTATGPPGLRALRPHA